MTLSLSIADALLSFNSSNQFYSSSYVNCLMLWIPSSSTLKEEFLFLNPTVILCMIWLDLIWFDMISNLIFLPIPCASFVFSPSSQPWHSCQCWGSNWGGVKSTIVRALCALSFIYKVRLASSPSDLIHSPCWVNLWMNGLHSPGKL